MARTKLTKETMAGIDAFLPRWQRALGMLDDDPRRDAALDIIDELLDLKNAVERFEQATAVPAAA